MSGALQAVFQNQRSFTTAPNSEIYTTAGTYSWVAPSGVTSVSVLVISPASNYKAGSLAYKNNYSVTPGNSYTVFLKSKTSCENVYSYFVSCATVGATPNAKTGDGGGLGGGAGGVVDPGGSGAGGYSGNGGTGSTNQGTGANGGNGAGGGGGGGASKLCIPGDIYLGGAGGGVGIYGSGSSGTGGTFGATNANGGTGGSSGGNGGNSTSVSVNATGGLYGGGRGTGGTGNVAEGAIRIVWPGATRTFPSTCVGAP